MKLIETPELQQAIQLLKDARAKYKVKCSDPDKAMIWEYVWREKIHDLICHIQSASVILNVEKR